METGRPYSRLLFRLERLKPLSAADKQRIVDLPLKLVNYPGDREILSHGHPASRCTFVLDGFLYSHKLVAGSRRQITSFYVPGDFVDLPTLYLPQVDHTVTTLGPAVLAFVPHEAIKEMLDESSALTQAFWRETLMQTAILQEWVANVGRRNAFARLAHIVCELTVRLRSVGLARDLSFSMPWTQMDVADACGISSVHANRVIQELRHLELVEWDSRRLKIRNWSALARLADFNDNYLQYHATAKSDLAPADQGIPEVNLASMRTPPVARGASGDIKTEC
jgi:CRP-like cAMP-binding protein